MATFTRLTDIWTQSYDQLNRPCWQNKKTGKIYYGSPGQVPAQPYVSFGYKADPNLPTGPDFTAAVGSRLEGFPLWQAFRPPPIGTVQERDATDMWTYGFDQNGRPCWLNKKTRKLHYDSVEGQPTAQSLGLVFTPTGPSPQSDPYVWPAVASCEEYLPTPAGGKKPVDEKGQWFLQRNEKGEQYYLNTTTGQWQYENPYSLKKSTRGK